MRLHEYNCVVNEGQSVVGDEAQLCLLTNQYRYEGKRLNQKKAVTARESLCRER